MTTHVTITLPTALREFSPPDGEVHVPGPIDVGRLLDAIRNENPKVYSRLISDNGKLRPFANIYINGTSHRTLPDDFPVDSTASVKIVMAIAGG
jgi:hypothetical protein